MQVVRDFSEDECPSMAAALAYSVLFAMPSLLLIVIFIAGVFLGPEAASGEIQARLSGSIGSQTAGQIQTMVSGVATNRTGGIIATTTSERP
jgi:membrane protein